MKKTGSLRIKQAERKMNRFDPLPDLGNANVGNIERLLTRAYPFAGLPVFLFLFWKYERWKYDERISGKCKKYSSAVSASLRMARAELIYIPANITSVFYFLRLCIQITQINVKHFHFLHRSHEHRSYNSAAAA